ncbi:helix-turn-helix domain-containing protein [Catellatospora citrea]|uniref:TetR family transcriptional regulator n=1 Tax=Catellatospora citrea TaxID=53366 RepID=A0A8J3P1T0_9ACTN|nr:TetR/AcrR family transcriptional regulator [Catellatospora citrea]RKE10857.1 TetR family transcriptional regulator [Catellatospora citrea]GIG00904.1 TetR family transcriptional regulator [Catellatospora citrea]
MSRLTRAQAQQRNRAGVLSAARAEFAARGYRETTVDGIAGRAGLTRGAVYSNFPGKRALYFAVLADDAERPAGPPPPAPGRTQREALGAYARATLTRLPVTTRLPDAAPPALDLVPDVLDDDRVRRPFAQLLKLQAILLGLALEGLRPAPGTPQPGGRRVRVAEAALTTLQGASVLAQTSPGFVEPFHIVATCEHLGGLDLSDSWQPVYAAHVPPPRPTDEPWTPAASADETATRPDAVHGELVDLAADGVVAVLGLHRLAAVEEAVRAAPPGAQVTAVLVSGTPGELMPLARLMLAEFRRGLTAAFPRPAWPRLRIVYDESGELAAAAGVDAVSDATEAAVRVVSGRIVARAEGYGACLAAAGASAAATRR